MNILCSFALKQLGRKEGRTLITASAIALSAALLTAVVNFVASGNAMLKNFLGKDYGLYGGAYVVMLLVPAVFLAALIIAMSVIVIVISNAFRMSANERIAQFGTLKCVGATKKQIYQTIMYECVLLCTFAIPLGVLAGYLLSFLGIGVVNLYDGRIECTRALHDVAGQLCAFLCFLSGSPACFRHNLPGDSPVFCNAPGKEGHAHFGAGLPAKRRRDGHLGI